MAARIPRLAKLLSLQNPIQHSFKRQHQTFLRKSIISSVSASPGIKTPHRSYSTQPPSSNKTTPKSSENATEDNNNNDMPDVLAGLKSIKMSRATKLVVYTALTIMATVESVFWIKVLWAKFGPAQKELEDEQN